MKVGDLVNYQGWKAIIAEVDLRLPDRLSYSLYFLNEVPNFLRTTENGLYPGFQCWQLKVLSEA
jgi:hypothetical protein